MNTELLNTRSPLLWNSLCEKLHACRENLYAVEVQPDSIWLYLREEVVILSQTGAGFNMGYYPETKTERGDPLDVQLVAAVMTDIRDRFILA